MADALGMIETRSFPAVVEAASAGEFFKQSILARMFDLRDVCIRVIQDCRGEDRRI